MEQQTRPESSRPTRSQRLGGMRLGSVWRQAAGEQVEQVKKTLVEELDREESIIG